MSFLAICHAEVLLEEPKERGIDLYEEMKKLYVAISVLRVLVLMCFLFHILRSLLTHRME